MRLGIIGKPQSGKTTIFNAAAGRQEAVGNFSQAAHRAIVKVPDERVDKLTEIVKPPKVTYAEIEYLDAPGFSGQGKQAAALEVSEDLRQSDALIAVIDAFSGDADPRQEFRNLLDEMILSDQVRLEGVIDRKAKKMKLTGDKSGARELDLLRRSVAMLEDMKPLIDLETTEDEGKTLRGFQLLTRKPVLAAINISEDKLPEADSMLEKFSDLQSAGRCEIVVLCGSIEMELATLEEEDRQAFMQDLGIAAPAMDRLIRRSYGLMGLISFLTVGEKEVRAWPVKSGITAQRAAGAVHSDIERGFIRAETSRYEDYLEYKTEAALKAAGKTRLEGKSYVIKDGDVILFRFNV